MGGDKKALNIDGGDQWIVVKRIPIDCNRVKRVNDVIKLEFIQTMQLN